MIAKAYYLFTESKFRLLLLTIVFLIVAVWRYSPLMPHVFYGDDLGFYLAYKDGQCGTLFSQLLTTVCADKYRPLPAGLVLTLFKLFDTAISHYMAVNVFLQAASALLVYAISYRLSKGNFVVSIGIALVVATSRFAAYQVTQVIGPVEGLALPIFLSIIYFLLRADEENQYVLKRGWISIILTFLLIHNHERYIVIPVWLAIAFLTLPNFRALQRKDLATLLLACVLLPIFYITYKTLFLNSPFLVGTGGTHIGFNYSRVLDHIYQATLSILGFNEGPEYLVGARFKSLHWNPSGYLAILFNASITTLFILGLRRTILTRDRTKAFFVAIRWPLLFAILIIFLLVPAISTIRLEQRWLFSPFILLLLLCAWSCGKLKTNSRNAASILVIMISISYFYLDTVIIKHFNNLFFVYSARYADIVKRDIADKYPGQTSPLRILTNPDHCEWTLIKGGFFRIYGGRARDVKCININDISGNSLIDGASRIFADQPQGSLLDITDYWNDNLKDNNGKVLYDFVKNFSSGAINDPVFVATPSGKGALVLPVATPIGPLNSLTIISGFSYKYSDIYVEKESELRFGLSMIYPADNISANVEIFDNNNPRKHFRFQQNVLFRSVNSGVGIVPVTIPLTRFEGSRVSIVFSATNAGANASGQWLAFSNPKIASLANH